jgi:DNA-binding NtrC family response regulator
MTQSQASGRDVHKRVVLVDDDVAMLGVIGALLAGAGHDVARFTQFSDAKKYLARHPADVLISDVRLGPFNGLQLAMLAKLQHPEMIAIVMSGFDDPVVRVDAAKADVEFLLKPFPAEHLLAKIGSRL